MSLEYLRKLISSSPYFSEIPPEEIDAVIKLIKPIEVAAGHEIIKQGDMGKEMYFIESGSVKIIHETADGNKVEKAERLGEGDFFGEMALIHDEARSASCIAATDCKLLVLVKDELESIMSSCQNLKAALTQAARERLYELLHPYYFKKRAKKRE